MATGGLGGQAGPAGGLMGANPLQGAGPGGLFGPGLAVSMVALLWPGTIYWMNKKLGIRCFLLENV